MITKIKGFKQVSRLITLIALAFVLPTYAFAGDTVSTESTTKAPEAKEKFNAGDVILEHVSDSHSWHIAGDFSLPLPVILYSKDRGLMMFSSSKLWHGAVYKGLERDPNGPSISNYSFKESGIHIVVTNPDGSINKEETAKIWDFSITKNVATIMLVALLLILVFSAVSSGYKNRGLAAPKGIQSFFEPIVMFIRDDIAIPSIGKKKYERFMPYLLTLFFFILFLNLLGLIPFAPGGANVTGNIAVTLTLACFTFVLMMANSTGTFWAHTLWMPGVPAPVKILILTPLEILGVVLKPFTLVIRMFANILAGHIIALSLVSLIFIFGAASAAVGYGVSLFSIPFGAGMLLLDVLVSLIQAYVFTLLSAIYFGMVTEESAHH